MKLHTIAWLAASLLIPASVAAQTTQKFTAGKVNEYGLVYTLPRTVIDVTVEAQQTVETPGEFFRYAKKYLGLQPITEKKTRWELTRAIITVRGESNETERYLVQFKAGSTPYMLLNDQNFPLTINTDSPYQPAEKELPTAVAARPTILERQVAKQAVTEEMLQSPSSAKRAELAAQRIYELRESRSDIISGKADQMPADGQAMKLVLDNLSGQEEALTAMFVGTVQKSTQVRSYTFTPAADADAASVVVARLSVVDGLVDADDLSGDPLTLAIRVVERGKLPVNEKGETKRFPKGGLSYCIPGRAEISVSYKGSKVAAENVDVAQYGIVFGLDPNLFTDKKAPAYAIFNPINGAIVEIGSK